MCIYTACKLCPLSIVTPSLVPLTPLGPPSIHHSSRDIQPRTRRLCWTNAGHPPPELEHKLLQHCCLCSCKNTNPTTTTHTQMYTHRSSLYMLTRALGLITEWISILQSHPMVVLLLRLNDCRSSGRMCIYPATTLCPKPRSQSVSVRVVVAVEYQVTDLTNSIQR